MKSEFSIVAVVAIVALIGIIIITTHSAIIGDSETYTPVNPVSVDITGQAFNVPTIEYNTVADTRDLYYPNGDVFMNKAPVVRTYSNTMNSLRVNNYVTDTVYVYTDDSIFWVFYKDNNDGKAKLGNHLSNGALYYYKNKYYADIDQRDLFNGSFPLFYNQKVMRIYSTIPNSLLVNGRYTNAIYVKYENPYYMIFYNDRTDDKAKFAYVTDHGKLFDYVNSGSPVSNKGDNVGKAYDIDEYSTDECFETDNGYDVSKRGSIFIGMDEFKDFCRNYNSPTLKEFYCLNGEVTYTDYICPAGCMNGVCQ